MALSANEQPEAYRIGSQIKLATTVGLLNDTNVAASNTKAALLAAILVPALPIGSSEAIRTQTTKAINLGFDMGVLTDALIAPLTSAKGLADLTGVPATYQGRAFYD